MSILWQYVAILALHWVADFCCQTHWQASNKSKRMDALVNHVASYTAVLAVGAFALFGLPGFCFAAINGVFHLATDFVTSRWSARYLAAGNWHNFFVVVGLDQLIHQATLAATLWWLVGMG